MRRLIAPGLLATGLLATTLAACSNPMPATPDAPAAPITQTPSPPPTSDPAKPSGGLIGEVSGLTGEITDFRVEQTATATIVEIASDVLFAYDSADLSPAAPAQLRRAADLIRQGAGGPVQVVGHTDSHGDDAYNLALSLRRARAVVAWLSTDGAIPVDRLAASGRGEAEPVAPNEGTEGNDYPEGRALNRRVTIVIPKA